MWEHGVPDSRLTVLRQYDDYINPNTGKRYARWLCECNCNEHNNVVVTTQNLKLGATKSCGCVQKEYNDVKLNLQDEYGEYGIGYCHNTGTEFYFDMDDYNKIKDICWTECTRHSIQCVVGTHPDTKKTITMHVFLGYKWHDHKDRNELNNRKYNLRPATAVENSRNKKKRKDNSSGFIGVSWNKSTQKWRARIHLNKKEITIGLFENKKDAVKARLNAEKEYYGEFSPQRHLFEEYEIK